MASGKHRVWRLLAGFSLSLSLPSLSLSLFPIVSSLSSLLIAFLFMFFFSFVLLHRLTSEITHSISFCLSPKRGFCFLLGRGVDENNQASMVSSLFLSQGYLILESLPCSSID